MSKLIGSGAVLLGWLLLFGLLLGLAHLRSKRKPLDSNGFRLKGGRRGSRPQLTSEAEPVILSPIAKSRAGPGAGDPSGGVKAS